MSVFYDLFESISDYTAQFYQLADSLKFYDTIAIAMITIVISICLLYYVVINHARLNKWYWWLLFAIVSSAICFGVSWFITDSSIVNFYAGEGLAVPNYSNDIFKLSYTVAIYAFLFYLLLSAVIKRFCQNCRHTPWKSVWPKH